MTTSIWGGTTVVQSTANADNSYLEQAFDIVLENTSVLELTTFVYAPNSGSLDVFINGARQELTKDYTETSSTEITIPGLRVGDRVVIRGLIGTTGAVQAQVSADASAVSAASSLASSIVAATQAAAAAQSAIQAANVATAISGTSVTSNSISLGSKTFTTQANKQFNPGTWITAIPTADTDQVISGPITSYDPVTGQLVFNAKGAIGVGGPFVSWNLSISGIQGIQGIKGDKGDGFLNYVKRSANVQIVNSNVATYFELSGTFTQTFDTPTALGNQWWSYIENAGTGTITIPASDGRTNWIVYPEEIRLFLCDGASISSKILRSFNYTGTITGTWAKPPGYSEFSGYLYTGGASGEGKNGASAAGGPSGAFTRFRLPASLFGNSELITVGLGGAGYANPALTMRFGGLSSIGSLISLAFDGTITPKAINPYIKYTDPTNPVLSLEMPGQGGTGASSSVVYAPGTSKMAGNGGIGSTGSAPFPTDGAAPGGGGGGIYTTGNIIASGSGARGEVNIRGIL